MSGLRQIRVTADHIARGKRGEAFCCPIALAVREQGRYGDGDVVVQPTGITIPYHDSDLVTYLPTEAIDFLDRFDGGCPVEPFEFTAEWVDDDGVEVPL